MSSVTGSERNQSTMKSRAIGIVWMLAMWFTRKERENACIRSCNSVTVRITMETIRPKMIDRARLNAVWLYAKMSHSLSGFDFSFAKVNTSQRASGFVCTRMIAQWCNKYSRLFITTSSDIQDHMDSNRVTVQRKTGGSEEGQRQGRMGIYFEGVIGRQKRRSHSGGVGRSPGLHLFA